MAEEEEEEEEVKVIELLLLLASPASARDDDEVKPELVGTAELVGVVLVSSPSASDAEEGETKLPPL